MKEQIQVFFNRPGINKSGLCHQAGVAPQNLNKCLRGEQEFTQAMLAKLLPVMEKYAFDCLGCEERSGHSPANLPDTKAYASKSKEDT
jgi:hypothetical protein